MVDRYDNRAAPKGPNDPVSFVFYITIQPFLGKEKRVVKWLNVR